MSERRLCALGLAAAVVLHLALATAYALHTPVFEAPDENDHFHYACFVAQRLPEQPTVLGSEATTGRTLWDQCVLGHHPPGYYLLLAAVLELAGASDVLPSPRVLGTHLGPFQFAHAHDETTRRSTEVDLVFALRLVSVLCGLASVILTQRTAMLLWPGRVGLATLAAVLLAALPQWSSAHGALDNGNLAATFAHLVVWLLARTLARDRFERGTTVWLGLALAAALWTKLNSLALFGVVAAHALAMAWRAPKGDRLRVLMRPALAMGFAALAFAPQLVRNLALYGDPLGQKAHELAFAASRLPEGALPAWLWEGFLPSLARSFVGFFGWWRVPLPDAAHALAAGVLGLAVLGALVGRRRDRGLPGTRWLLWLSALAAFAFVLRFNLSFAQPQGRYLFPAAGAFTILAAAGLDALGRRIGWARGFSGGLAALWGGGAIAVFVGVAVPAFRLPVTAQPPHEAIVHGALRADTPSATRDVTLLEPADGAVLDAAPGFRWRAPSDAAPRTLHVWLTSGRVLLATWEMGRIDLSAGAFELPAELWDAVPAGAELRWNVRRVADRSRGEAACDTPGSATASLRRR